MAIAAMSCVVACGGSGAMAPSGIANNAPAAQPTLAPSPVVSGPSFVVNATALQSAISPDIYGISFFYNGPNAAAQDAFAHTIHLTANRIGGDATTRYNWQYDSSNSGRDWYFVGGNGQSSATPGSSMDAIVTKDIAVGAKTILTIPMIEYINSASAWHCSFPESVYGAQQSYDPYLHPGGDNCGNGVLTNGTLIPQESPIVSDMPNSPSIQKAWIQHLVTTFGSAAHGGVPIYEMDNEPSGWQAIHRDVHPAVTTCAELQTQTFAYAPVIKSADPIAKVLGPDDIPAADVLSCSGVSGRGLWYLQLMAAYQQTNGVRLLDYFGLHYPGWGSGDPIANAQARIKLHQGWIAKAYPGTLLAYDEYNWGATEGSLAETLMTADGLGLFGAQGVSLASYWGLSNPSTDPTANAFLIYRNYDGKGSRFGDVSLQTSSLAPGLEVYSARRTGDGAITTMVVNRQTATVNAAFVLENHSPKGPVQIYQYSSANLASIVREPNATMSGAVLQRSYPANSFTLLVVP
ncbi:MAG: endoglucanase [Candidatus Eremiobacteraeota bacterium]|nr:endoglucanase [Candidatus Eremiobacteraeota bacterium]